MRVSEIRVKRIRVNQGLGVFHPARLDKLETPPEKVILTTTRAMQGMSHK